MNDFYQKVSKVVDPNEEAIENEAEADIVPVDTVSVEDDLGTGDDIDNKTSPHTGSSDDVEQKTLKVGSITPECLSNILDSVLDTADSNFDFGEPLDSQPKAESDDPTVTSQEELISGKPNFSVTTSIPFAAKRSHGKFHIADESSQDPLLSHNELETVARESALRALRAATGSDNLDHLGLGLDEFGMDDEDLEDDDDDRSMPLRSGEPPIIGGQELSYDDDDTSPTRKSTSNTATYSTITERERALYGPSSSSSSGMFTRLKICANSRIELPRSTDPLNANIDSSNIERDRYGFRHRLVNPRPTSWRMNTRNAVCSASLYDREQLEESRSTMQENIERINDELKEEGLLEEDDSVEENEESSCILENASSEGSGYPRRVFQTSINDPDELDRLLKHGYNAIHEYYYECFFLKRIV